MEEKISTTVNKATRIYASTLGILVGLAGIQHGYFETLQGDVRPENILIDAIGPAQRYWEFGTETALTIIPSFLISGVLAMAIGILVIIWSFAFIDRKYGAAVFLGLSIALFLVGGGFAPIFLTILAFIAATRINKPLIWWRSRSPNNLRNLMAMLWPWSLVVAAILFVVAVEIAIFGKPLLTFFSPETTFSFQTSLGWVMLVLSIVALPAANAHDAQSHIGLAS